MAGKAYGYVRVSTNKQDNERQIYEIKDFCKRNDIELIKIIKDQESGGALQRTKLKEALEKTYKYDYFIVQHSSRLTRLGSGDFKYIIHHLTHHGVIFKSVSQSYLDLANAFIRNIILEFTAEMDKEERAELQRRVKSKYNAKKAHAEALGKKVVWGRKELPKEKAEEIIRLREAGLSYRAIANKVTYKLKNGKIKNVSHGTIRKVLKNPPPKNDSQIHIENVNVQKTTD